MVKTFCDICGMEITNKNFSHPDLTFIIYKDPITNKQLSIKIITGNGKYFNQGRFCKYCIIDTVVSADDRTKEAK
ncbi:hypothetical protein A2619_04395 [candidate division WWE3 bacterium RIFOXYD1_FULL_39_9]|uniref:Uncharacterized protein n=1 Tax=candidate division WWE3 bacterium RIFOXYD1_FULL_39_9 TaxID=1802649 RepID=A0A1F4X6A2_UNCKA|nr:MAG: hypothetical protein A2619_04395 [candidate division WWE3 bacterium RIFOXYD1_FULL_39_9]